MQHATPQKRVGFGINPNQINHLSVVADQSGQMETLESRVMLKRTLLILCCVASAHAAPSNNAADDIERYLAERGIVAQMDQVRQSVGDTASDLVGNAMTFLGVPYRRGGTNATTGFDCSGFVRSMFEQTVGKVLPRRASEQAAATEKIDKQELKPGDLVFFNTMRQTFSHVGIYVGDNKFIHSPRPGKQVKVEDMRDAYWERRFTGARRVPGSGNSDAN
jgi:cell wall-associated NlpC family hydrolase